MQSSPLAHLEYLKDKQVCIFCGGPGEKKGRLVAVKNDHLVLLTEEMKYLYYQTHHIKRVTWNSTDTTSADSTLAPVLSFVEGDHFRDILRRLLYRRVQINEGDHDDLKGIMVQLFDDHVDLVLNHEIIKVFTDHIKNISCLLEGKTTSSSEATVESNVQMEQPSSVLEMAVVQLPESMNEEQAAERAEPFYVSPVFDHPWQTRQIFTPARPSSHWTSQRMKKMKHFEGSPSSKKANSAVIWLSPFIRAKRQDRKMKKQAEGYRWCPCSF